jgi:hypothetical protein
MRTEKIQKFVLLIDCDCEEAQRTAIELAGAEGYVLVARKAESAFEFAKQHQPSHIVIPQSQAAVDSKIPPQVLLEFSPEAEIVVVRG